MFLSISVKENKIGSLKEFVKEFCMCNKFYLAPNQAPDVNKILKLD